VNHRSPSGPAVIPCGELPVPVKVVATPAIVIRPTLFSPGNVYHSAPSGPAAMPTVAVPLPEA
jgi:hypothetical protein